MLLVGTTHSHADSCIRRFKLTPSCLGTIRAAGSGHVLLWEPAEAALPAYHKARHHRWQRLLPAVCCCALRRRGQCLLLTGSAGKQLCLLNKDHKCSSSCSHFNEVFLLSRTWKSSASSFVWITWPRWHRRLLSGRSMATCSRISYVERAAVAPSETDLTLWRVQTWGRRGWWHCWWLKG